MAARPPRIPPAIAPARLCDCDTVVWPAPDVVAAACPVVEDVEVEVVEDVAPVGIGRGLKFEVGRDDEGDGLLVVVDEDGLD